MLDASIIAHQLIDVRISEGDKFCLHMRNLPSKVSEFRQLHQNATTVQQIFAGVQDYYIRIGVQDDIGSVHVTQPVQKPGDQRQNMFQLWEERSFSIELSAVIVASTVMLEKTVGRSMQTRNQSLKPKLSSLLERTRKRKGGHAVTFNYTLLILTEYIAHVAMPPINI